MFRRTLPVLDVTPLPASKCMIGRNKLEAIRQHDLFHNTAHFRKWSSWRFLAAGAAIYAGVRAVTSVVSPSSDNHH